MSFFSNVIKSVQSVARKLTGGNSYVVPKPVSSTPLKPLPAPNYQTLQPIQKAYTPQQFAANAKVMKNNTAAMRANAAAIAESQRVAAENAARIERERAERERRRKAAQDGFDAAKSHFTDKNKKNVKAAAGKWGDKKGDDAIKVKDSSGKAYDDDYKKAYKEAMAEYYAQMNSNKKGFFSKIWDKVSFGQDQRQQKAREYAQKKAQEIGTKGLSDYENKLNNFLKQQAAKKAAVENSKFATQGQFDQALSGYSSWEAGEIASLEKQRAVATAKLEAFGSASSSKLTTKVAKTAGFIGDKLKSLESNNWWKYTLGQGSKNAPSIVTAPSRVVNWLGNLNTKDRSIYQSGGGVIDRSKTKDNAWQAGFNQRNFNIRPVIDKPFKKSDAYAFLTRDSPDKSGFGASLQGTKLSSDFSRAKSDKQEDIAKKWWDERNKFLRNQNSLQEFGADPLNALGLVAGTAKKLGFVNKATTAAKASKVGAWTSSTIKKATQLRPAKWLATEYKSASEKLAEAVEARNKVQKAAQNSLFPRINQLNKKLVSNPKMDISVFDDFKNLSDSEAKVLQRMRGGKLSARDQVVMFGRGMKPAREKLEGIAAKWINFAEEMQLSDNVKNTRFGRGQKLYAPKTAWARKDLSKYDFRRLQKSNKILNKDEFYQGTVDRYFKSNIDETFARSSTAKKAQQKAEKDLLLKKYDEATNPLNEAVIKAEKAANTPWEKVKKLSPTRLWKKSVLKYRPAWTVNNVLYNTQAGVLAGGGRSIVEQAKMLSPRYWRKAMDESRDVFGGNLGKEIGKGKLDRFYTGVEDWSRVAAGRAAMSKGLTKEAAKKRVDKYLFDYSIKNWERLPKAVVPFWSFQKNLAKAAATMPFDRPLAAAGYNRIDRHQQQQFDKDFEKTRAQLKESGYTDDEIDVFKEEQKKYYGGKFKVGDKYVNTPFNAFSDKGMSSLGINPWITAAAENANSQDSFGAMVKGKKASLMSRIWSKFPQVDIGQQAWQSHQMRTGKTKPVEGWIGKPGGEGYGLGKQKQGFDKSKASYNRSLDPSAKLAQNALAFAGVPRTTEFDKDRFVKSKVLNKATSEYFNLNTKDLDYNTAEAKRQAVFKKYKITPDEFYKGVLAKYDTDNTKGIKKKKEDAATANKNLFEEYSKQPVGKRNLWAVNKLRELNTAGYFDDNPFLKSFDWITPDKVGKADRQAAYVKRGPSAKKIAYDKAKRSGNWSDYTKKFGTNRKASPYQHDGKFFKTAASRDKYIAGSQSPDGKFWRDYALADKETRRQLLRDNPQYNKRANWTDDMWSAQKKTDKEKLKAKAKTIGNFAAILEEEKAKAKIKARAFTQKSKKRRNFVYSR